jgi:zinc transport system substrate-binding protein
VDRDAGLPSGAPDPHIWLDPELVKIQASTIAAALSQLDPVHAAEYKKNLQALAADLDRVNAELAAALAPLKGKSFMVYHPAFGYFAAAYGLKQVAVESEGKEPSAKELADLIDRAKQEQVKVIFVEPQFSKKSAAAVAAAVGATVVAMDPLAPDYLHNLEAMAGQIRQALTEGQANRSH